MTQPKGSRLIGHEFKFTVKEIDGDWLIPTLWIDGEEVGFTQGRTDAETLEMIADCFACHMDIEYPWYDRWYAAFKRIFNLP